MDSDAPAHLRLTREIPLWGVVSLVLALAGQATAMYYGLSRQAEKLDEQIASTKTLNENVRQLTSALSTKDLKDMEHDLRLSDHERRLLATESQTFLKAK